MPIYEFHCTNCASEFEELVRSSKPEALAQVACPECGSHKVKKKVSNFASSVTGDSSTPGSAASCAPSGSG